MDSLFPGITSPPTLCTYTTWFTASSIVLLFALLAEQTYLDIGWGTSSHNEEAVLMLSYAEAPLLLRIHCSTVQSSKCSGIKDDLRVYSSMWTAVQMLGAGMLILQRSLQQNRAASKMLNERLQEARAGKLHAEREHAKAEAVAAGLQHDLELLKHQVTTTCLGVFPVMNSWL